MTATLGRSPTPIELAERTGASVEHVIEALVAGERASPGFAGPPAAPRTATR